MMNTLLRCRISRRIALMGAMLLILLTLLSVPTVSAMPGQSNTFTRSWRLQNSSSSSRRRTILDMYAPSSSTSILLQLRGGGAVASDNKQKNKKLTKRQARKSAAAVQSSSSSNNKSSAATSASTQQQLQQQRRITFLIRTLFLTYYASLGSLMPYLPVYYDSLGHGGLIIGMLGAVKPLTTFLVAPFWGILSDQLDRKFTVLYISFLTSFFAQLLVSFRSDVRFLLGMVFITAVFNAPVKSLMDSIVLDHLPNKADYGRMRLWGQMGFGLGSSMVGILLHRSKGYNPEIPWEPPFGPPSLRPYLQFLHQFWMSITGYRLLFLAYASLSIPTWLALRTFDKMDQAKKNPIVEASSKKVVVVKSRRRWFSKTTVGKKSAKNKKKEPAKIQQGLALLFTNADALLFFFLVFVVGTSSGVIENFAYVRMREVGGTGREMGFSRLVSSAAGAPMFWFSGPLTELLGADKVLTLALLSYVCRFYLYAFMKNPYQGLPAEALRGVTFAAFWSTGTIYAHKISPPGMSTTMLMFMNAMYGGLGQSLGAIIGGNLQSRFGTVRTFLLSGTFDLFFVAILMLYLNLRKTSSFKDPKPIGTITTT